MEQAELIWHNGEFVAWEDAKVHVLSHGLHYGTGVFEGIRCYETERGPAIFRHPEHLIRLEKSAELYYFDLPYSADELRAATHELIRRNDLCSWCYIRSLAFPRLRRDGAVRTERADRRGDNRHLAWGAYLGEEGRSTAPHQGLLLADDLQETA